MKANSTKKIKRPPAPADVKEKVADLAAAATEEVEAGGFMDPVAKKRGRPKGSKTRPREPEVLEPAPDPQAEINAIKPLMRPMWGMISQAGVKIAETPEAAIGPAELEVLVDTSAACVHQYLPGLLGTHANLIVLCVTFSQWSLKVYMLRQLKLAELIEERRRREEEHLAKSTPVL